VGKSNDKKDERDCFGDTNADGGTMKGLRTESEETQLIFSNNKNPKVKLRDALYECM
jgi:hypothetical protein